MKYLRHKITPLSNSDGCSGGMKLWDSSVGTDLYPIPGLYFSGLECMDLLSWLFPESHFVSIWSYFAKSWVGAYFEVLITDDFVSV